MLQWNESASVLIPVEYMKSLLSWETELYRGQRCHIIICVSFCVCTLTHLTSVNMSLCVCMFLPICMLLSVCCLVASVAGAVGYYSAGEQFAVCLCTASVPALSSLSLSLTQSGFLEVPCEWTGVLEDGQ